MRRLQNISSGEFKKVSNRRLGDENRQFIQTCLEFLDVVCVEPGIVSNLIFSKV